MAGTKKYKEMIDGVYQVNKRLPDFDQFFELPKSWFVKQVYKGMEMDENWEAQISMNVTKSFDKVAFLNRHRRTYIAFT